MDFLNAAILVGTVWILTDAVKRAWPGGLPNWLVPFVALGLGIAAAFLVSSAEHFGDTQLIDGVAMNDMSGGDKVLVGLFLGTGAAGAIHQINKSVQNIGENKTADPPA